MSEKPAQDRPLTSGEIAMARSVFGDQIDYRKVRVGVMTDAEKKDSRVPALEESHNVIHASDKHYHSDYSSSHVSLDDQAGFIHEMTHVWQEQHNVFGARGVEFKEARLVAQYGIDNWHQAYIYNFDKTTHFSHLNQEQQAAFVEDYFTNKKTWPDPSVPDDDSGVIRSSLMDYKKQERLLHEAGIPANVELGHQGAGTYDVKLPAQAARGNHNQLKEAAAPKLTVQNSPAPTTPRPVKDNGKRDSISKVPPSSDQRSHSPPPAL